MNEPWEDGAFRAGRRWLRELVRYPVIFGMALVVLPPAGVALATGGDLAATMIGTLVGMGGALLAFAVVAPVGGLHDQRGQARERIKTLDTDVAGLRAQLEGRRLNIELHAPALSIEPVGAKTDWMVLARLSDLRTTNKNIETAVNLELRLVAQLDDGTTLDFGPEPGDRFRKIGHFGFKDSLPNPLHLDPAATRKGDLRMATRVEPDVWARDSLPIRTARLTVRDFVSDEAAGFDVPM